MKRTHKTNPTETNPKEKKLSSYLPSIAKNFMTEQRRTEQLPKGIQFFPQPREKKSVSKC